MAWWLEHLAPKCDGWFRFSETVLNARSVWWLALEDQGRGFSEKKIQKTKNKT